MAFLEGNDFRGRFDCFGHMARIVYWLDSMSSDELMDFCKELGEFEKERMRKGGRSYGDEIATDRVLYELNRITGIIHSFKQDSFAVDALLPDGTSVSRYDLVDFGYECRDWLEEDGVIHYDDNSRVCCDVRKIEPIDNGKNCFVVSGKEE